MRPAGDFFFIQLSNTRKGDVIMILATEIIKEQREKIEEQIKFYEDMCKALLADAERMSNKAKNLREYLDKNYSD